MVHRQNWSYRLSLGAIQEDWDSRPQHTPEQALLWSIFTTALADALRDPQDAAWWIDTPTCQLYCDLFEVSYQRVRDRLRCGV
jgi:hypothetical protein